MRIIHDTVSTFDAGFGLVSIDRPTDMYLGRKLWHCDFRFTAPDGREYWGTAFREPLVATVSVELRTRSEGSKGWSSRRLPESHKTAWRDSIAAHAGPVIAAARKEARRG